MELKTTDYGVCKVIKNTYGNNGNLSLKLVDRYGMPITSISTNIIPLLDDNFCLNITNITGNLLDDIINSNLFKDTGDVVPSGFCSFPVYSLV